MTDPYASPDAESTSAPTHAGLTLAAGISFLVAGILELCFLALALMGTLMGGAITAAALFGTQKVEDGMLGGFLLVIYGLWFIAVGVAGPTHVATGIGLVSGRWGRRALIAGSVVSVLPLVTVYCAATSLISGVLGLMAILVPPSRPPGASTPR